MKQQGFTLIELMIVVAIIGILAAVGIPAYSDYTAKAQMSEAFTLLDGAKTDLVTAMGESGTCAAPKIASGKFVSGIAAAVDGDTGCKLTATMQATGVNKELQGKQVSMTYDTGTGLFTYASVDVPAKFLPSAWKN